ncbi:MAG: phytanoyl-CoA dioxygenase family protein [Deltaproteobacteria bacterium]
MFQLFSPYVLSPREKAELDERGHLSLPGILTPAACARLTEALGRIAVLQEPFGYGRRNERTPGKYAAEFDTFLASLIGHPELLALARSVLGSEIRYDHCVALNRLAANPGMRWHTHEYSDADPSLRFLRIFFYVNGFEAQDGGLKAVPGSHLFRDSKIMAETDEELERLWIEGKRHPLTGEPLRIERLSAPPATVILMWTHALHGVTARRSSSATRWTVVYAYRNPGQPSPARWISDEFEHSSLPGAEGLMSLY